MISKRQFEILNRLYTHQNIQINLEQLADFLDVSSRTIRSDLEALQEELKDESMSVSIIRNKAILQIYDSQKAEQYMDQLSSKTQKMIHFVDENQRAKYIIEKMLLSNKDYINMDDIADELFISRSRLSNDLKIVQSILQKYDLQLDKLRGVGIRVLGDTLNKRNCLIKESTVVVAENIKKIRNEKYNHMIDNAEEVVTDVLVNNNYILSDIALQNLIVHVAATVEMLLRNHLIDYEKEEIAYGAYLHEYDIAKKIFAQFQKKFYFPYNEREIQLLAISIHGKREYDNNDYIANELNNKVYKGLKKVKERFHMDFSVNINLRISLALHLEPLITRLKTHSQLENVLIYDVKKSYPLAFEIATCFINEIYPEYMKEISDDELSFLACHFVGQLEELSKEEKNKTVLILTKQKKSNIVLLRQQLNKKFPSIQSIDIYHDYNSLDLDLDAYDCIVVTERELTTLNENCIFIHYFINTEYEETRIALSLAGFKVKDFLNKFSSQLFQISSFHNKQEVLNSLCQQALKAGVGNEDLLPSLQYHEDNSSSYFGNHIAICHPEDSITDTTFISVVLSDSMIQWGLHEVNFVMFLSIEKNDIQQYKNWNYISFIISNENNIHLLHQCTSFESFMQTLQEIFKLTV